MIYSNFIVRVCNRLHTALLIALLVTPSLVIAAPTLVQHYETILTGNANGTQTVSFQSATTTGNFILVALGTEGVAVPATYTCADNRGNTYRGNTSAQIVDTGNLHTKIWWVENATGGNPHTFTIQLNPTGYETGWISISEWSGIYNGGDPYDQSAFDFSYGSLTSGNTPTTTQAGELIVGIIHSTTTTGPYTVGTNFTIVGQVDNHLGVQYRTVSSTGAYASTWSITTAQWIGNLVVTFKEATAAAVGKTDAYRNALSDRFFRGTSFSFPTTLTARLYSTCPTVSGGGTELTGSGYSAATVDPGTGTWSLSTAGSTTNSGVINFGTASSNWTPVTCIGLESGGTLYYFGQVTGSPVTVYSGETARIPIGSFQISETDGQ